MSAGVGKTRDQRATRPPGRSLSGWLALAALAISAACSKAPALTPLQQGQAMAETVADRPACRGFVARLIDPANDAVAVTRIQREAAAGHCLKPTV